MRKKFCDSVFSKLLVGILLLSGVVSKAQCWSSMATGMDFSVAVSNDGKLWVWGRNQGLGVYGNGTTNANATNNPVQVGTASNWASVSATFGSIAAVRTDGTLWTWGQNTWGELGNGAMPTASYTPGQIGTLTNWTNIAGGRTYATFHSVKNGVLWAWGSNQPNGQLGNGSITNSSVPIQIGTATNWRAIYPGANFTVGIKTDGTLWVWGSNGGVYGNGTTADTVAGRSPMQVGTATDWKMASCGDYTIHAIKNNGTLWAWGSNSSGQYGNGTTTSSYVPVQIGTATNWLTIADGGSHAVAIKTNGTLWTWGSNSNGQLGNGTTTANPTPVQVGTATNWQMVSADIASGNSFAKNTAGEIWGTGKNNYGQLGNGTLTASNVFVKITGCPAVIANPDSGTALSGFAGTAVANVRANDTYNGTAANSSNTTLAFASSTHAGITLNTSTGAVLVAANVPAGTYTLTYTLCATANPNNCTTGTVTVTVNPPVINAVDNDFSGTAINYTTGGNTASVTGNDTLNGSAVSNANINITLVNNGGLTGATISNTGVITIPAGTFVGTFTLTYQICQALNPTNCDQANVIVTTYEPILTTPPSVVGIRANNRVSAIGIQTGGKIIITGGFTTYNNISSKYIARLNTDLTLDTTFLSTGPTNSQSPIDFRIQADNKIVMMGWFSDFNGGSNGNGLIRLNADGTVDTGFNVGGTGVSGSGNLLRSMGLQANGKILLGGGFLTGFNGAPCRNMIRLNTDGTVDNTFNFHYTTNGSGQQLYGAILSILPLPNGKIVVGGIKNSLAGAMPNVFQLNADGSLDTTFTTGDTGVNVHQTNCSSCVGPIENLVLQPDGKILVMGAFDSYNGNTAYKNIVRLNTNGTIDTSFSIGTSSDRAIKDAAYDTVNNKIFIAGEMNTFNGTAISKIARLNFNGSLDTTFSSGTGFTNVSPSSPTLYALRRQGDGKVIVGGSFNTYNGVSALNVTRLQPSVAGGQARNVVEIYQTDDAFNQTAKQVATQLETIGQLAIYPNPSNGIFNLDLSGFEKGDHRIEVYSLLGSLVYQKSLTAGSQNEIDLTAVQRGYYIAKIYSDGAHTSVKLLKN